jgi:hypothetical protein
MTAQNPISRHPTACARHLLVTTDIRLVPNGTLAGSDHKSQLVDCSDAP